MVSVGASKLGCTANHFVEPRSQSEWSILSQQLTWTEVTARRRGPTPVIPGRVFVFQQDGVPAHRARDTITFLEQQTPDFISPTLWPSNSPDLNPVDHSVWSVLQEKVYRSKIADVDELKTRLIDEWAQFDQSIFDVAISQRRRLSTRVRVRGAHFEHKF